MFNQFQNPFMLYPQYTPQFQQTQVVRVNGKNGAEAYNMGANSSALLLDESGTMVWLVTSDGAGYKSVSAYDITPHKDVPVPDYGSLENRIAKLEGIVNEYTANLATAKLGADAELSRGQTNDGYGQRCWQSDGSNPKSGRE